MVVRIHHRRTCGDGMVSSCYETFLMLLYLRVLCNHIKHPFRLSSLLPTCSIPGLVAELFSKMQSKKPVFHILNEHSSPVTGLPPLKLVIPTELLRL